MFKNDQKIKLKQENDKVKGKFKSGICRGEPSK